MSIFRIILTTLFFLVVPVSTSIGEESPLKDDVKYDEVQANTEDFKQTAEEEASDSKVLLAACEQENCTTDK